MSRETLDDKIAIDVWTAMDGSVSEYVQKVATEILNPLDLHNFLKLLHATKNEFLIDGKLYRGVIEAAALNYKYAYGWTFKLTGRSTRGVRSRALELAAMARGTFNQDLNKDLAKLSTAMIKNYFSLTSDYVGVDDFTLYIKTFALANLTVTAMAGPNFDEANAFIKALNKEINKSGRSEEFDTSAPSKRFLDIVATRQVPYTFLYFSKTPYITAVIVLRALYGEKILFEVFDKHPSGLENPAIFLRVVQNWEQLKDYPLEWILAMDYS